jgi:hypothetical protein
MTAKIDDFIAEVRNAPEFVAAMATRPQLDSEMEAVENGLALIERKANDDSEMIEMLDRVQTAISRKDLSIKQRLIEVIRVFTELHAAGRTIN